MRLVWASTGSRSQFNPCEPDSIPPASGLGDGLSGPVGIPQTTVTDDSFVFGGPSGFPQGRDTTTGVLADTVTMVAGKHQVKWGGEYRRYLLYSFTGKISARMSSTAAQPRGERHVRCSRCSRTSLTTVCMRRRWVGSIQDNYKMLPGLMLEYGVRFEWNGTPVEGENRMSMFQPVGSTTSTLIQVGTNGIPREPYKQNYNLELLGYRHTTSSITRRPSFVPAYGYLVDQPVAGTSTILTGNPPFTTAVSYSNSAAPQPLSNIYKSAAAASGFARLGTSTPISTTRISRASI